jgi:hypothetical protein
MVDEEIASMRVALGLPSDAQLAEMLGYTPGAITQWRRRGGVPDKARRRFESYQRNISSGHLRQRRRDDLGKEIMFAGRFLAIFLAPSVDAAGRRFKLLGYEDVLREYTSYFNEIELACAEEVSETMSRNGANATEALHSLSGDASLELYWRIIQRAHEWRDAESFDGDEIARYTVTFGVDDNRHALHDKPVGFTSKPRDE